MSDEIGRKLRVMTKPFSRFFCAALLLAALATAHAARAQGELSKKPYTAWTKAEAESVLRDSPWARSQSVKLRVASRSRRVAGAPVTNDGGGPALASQDLGGAEAPIDFTFTLRLRSALRVRQALVRLRQIEAGYDKMDAARRAAFDADPKNKGLLECPACAENYVLTLSAKSKESPGADPVYASLKGARLAELQRYVYVADERGGDLLLPARGRRRPAALQRRLERAGLQPERPRSELGLELPHRPREARRGRRARFLRPGARLRL